MNLQLFKFIRSLEVRGILFFLIIIASILGFYALAVMVTGESTPAFDQYILQVLRNEANLADPIGPAWVEEAARDITALGSITILIFVTFTVACTLFFTGLRKRSIILLGVTLIALIASHGLKQVVDRARPELVDHQTRVFTQSFPSAHAMNASAVYLTIAALLAGLSGRKRVKTVCISMSIGITLLIGISRIYLGVHWPTDVLAGWLGGVIITLASVLAGQLLTTRSASFHRPLDGT